MKKPKIKGGNKSLRDFAPKADEKTKQPVIAVGKFGTFGTFRDLRSL